MNKNKILNALDDQKPLVTINYICLISQGYTEGLPKLSSKL